MQFFGHPCDRPKDIRARPFILDWATEDRKLPSKYRDVARPVFRVEYQCLGGCNTKNSNASEDDEDKDNSDSGSEDEDVDVDDDDDDDDDDDENENGNENKKSRREARGIDEKIKEKSIAKKRGPKNSRCPHKVKIHVRNSQLLFLLNQFLNSIIFRLRFKQMIFQVLMCGNSLSTIRLITNILICLHMFGRIS